MTNQQEIEHALSHCEYCDKVLDLDPDLDGEGNLIANYVPCDCEA
jgi:hypothetical protein